jgi:hypothetical protein
MRRITTLVVAAFLASGASAAGNVRKVAPERLSQYWLLQSSSAAQASLPFRGKNLHAPTCAAVAYTIGNDGRVRDVKLEKIVPDGDLAKVAVDVVSRMRFAAVPQNANRLPVRTYVVMPFNLPSANAPNADDRERRAQAMAACHLSGYGEKEVVIPVR